LIEFRWGNAKEAAMIELTEEQAQILARSPAAPVRAIDRTSGTEYVLLRASVYERFQTLLGGETVYTTAEMLDRTMAEDDAHDPHLAKLQEQYGSKA
jgi:hypothetical protein